MQLAGVYTLKRRAATQTRRMLAAFACDARLSERVASERG